MKVLAVHQPNYLPYIGFFDKMAKADLMILNECMEYSKEGFTNRNRILMNGTPIWLTVPVGKKNHGKMIGELPDQNKDGWKEKHYKSIIEAYHTSPYVEDLKCLLNDPYKSEWASFAEMTEHLICEIKDYLEIDTPVLRNRHPEYAGKKGLLGLCRLYKADTYLSGDGAREYMQNLDMKEVKVVYQNFTHPVYKQMKSPFANHLEFVPNLSIIDAIANLGKNTSTLINPKVDDCRNKNWRS